MCEMDPLAFSDVAGWSFYCDYAQILWGFNVWMLFFQRETPPAEIITGILKLKDADVWSNAVCGKGAKEIMYTSGIF